MSKITCKNCGSIEITDGFITIELGKCQSAFNKLYKKHESLVDYLKIVLCDMPISENFDEIFMGIERKLKSLGDKNT